jgi:hypothetical protein
MDNGHEDEIRSRKFWHDLRVNEHFDSISQKIPAFTLLKTTVNPQTNEVTV